MRLGILGGTFDPVHYGHLLLAECAREQCQLDRVWFMPAATPPHKQSRRLSPPEHRLNMLDLAITGNEAFEVSRYEIDRGGISYTADTLETLRAQDPQRELFFLLGSDSLDDLTTWHEPQRICRAATLAVVHRAGTAEPDLERLRTIATPAQIERFRQCLVTMPLIELSSTDIRQRVASGKSIRYRTPRAVEKYIETHRLYGPPAQATSPETAVD